jgi:hypothetical protein
VDTPCQCNAGHTGPNGGTCTTCVAGKYKTISGSTECVSCDAGKYSATVVATVEPAYLACPALSTSAAGSTLLANCLCNTGVTGPNGGTCSACVAGKYKNFAGSGTCTDCEAGKYSVTVGATECLPCPGVSTSAADRTSCQCNAGYTGTTCSACAFTGRSLDHRNPTGAKLAASARSGFLIVCCRDCTPASFPYASASFTHSHTLSLDS